MITIGSDNISGNLLTLPRVFVAKFYYLKVAISLYICTYLFCNYYNYKYYDILVENFNSNVLYNECE